MLSFYVHRQTNKASPGLRSSRGGTGSRDERRIRCLRDLIFVLSVDYADETVSLGWGEVNIWAKRGN